MKAFCLIRDQPVYRRDAFMAGLRAAGYDARTGGPQGCAPGDVLVIWNRYADVHERATAFEKAGGTVLVAENGYIAPGGESPHDQNPRTWFALARHAHNGRGEWHVGGPERWDALGIDLKPWRTEGDHILVCPNRGFGQPGGIMPTGWARKVKERLEATTKRPVRIREHPGNDAPKVPLSDDLRNAWAVAIWSSSAGVRALIEGVSVYREAPWWICGDATDFGIAVGAPDAVQCKLMDARRLRALRRLAWAQWNIEEIATGEPFRYLLSHTWQTESAAAL